MENSERYFELEEIEMNALEDETSYEEEVVEFEAIEEVLPIQSVDSQFSKKKVIRLSRVEKLVYLVIMLVAVVFAFAIVYSITTVQSIDHESAQLKTKLERENEKVGELRQKRNELSNTERVKKVAKKKGLSIDNARRKSVD